MLRAILTILFIISALFSVSQAQNSFFPVGIFSVNPPSEFKEVKKAGFNTVHTYEFEAKYLKHYIAIAKKLGLKVLIFPSFRIKGKEDAKFSILKKFISQYKDDDTILAWYLAEEPVYNKIDSYIIRNLNNFIKKNDSKHPTVVFLSQPKYALKYAKCSDIIMTGVYPIGKQDILWVAKYVELARRSARPVWALIQAFGYQNERYRAWGWEREPNYEEMRMMSYLAIAHGAEGIFFYTYHGSQYNIKFSPDHWKNLVKVVKELNTDLPFFLGKKLKLIVLKEESPYQHFFARISQKDTLIVLLNPYPHPLELRWGFSKDNLKKEFLLPLEVKKIKFKNGRSKKVMASIPDN